MRTIGKECVAVARYGLGDSFSRAGSRLPPTYAQRAIGTGAREAGGVEVRAARLAKPRCLPPA